MCKIPTLKKDLGPALISITGVIYAAYVFNHQIISWPTSSLISLQLALPIN